MQMGYDTIKMGGEGMELRHVAQRAARLSAILKEDMGVSTALMNKLKWQDKILVNGTSQRTNFPVQHGDVITLPLEEAEPEYPAEDGELTILYEDDHLLAVDKPAGMLIHPSRSRNTGTLANLVVGYYQKTGQHCAFHPMTRLDRDTFGIVLLAKNAHVHTLLQQTDVEKIYHALVFGGPEENRGTIDLPIARKPLPSLLREIRPDGKPSVTEFTVLQRSGETAKLALKPITGRTHQLRLHCAHMGYPILGDPQYGNEASLEYSRQLGLASQLLCAKSLRFTHPITAEQLHLQSQMDAGVER
jgi:23S rRNA pseudouridine1911/1915/1917 synthase